MSLQLAAQHLAAQGRGPDKQLVHMSPREVAGLQALAMAHGGSLSINPDTGLPEAGVLDNLLPAIIGAGLMFATGGAAGAAIIPGLSNAATIGLGIGALQTARTGDLGKGIMAGLGAYGGAGLGAGLAGPGMTVVNPQAAQIAAAQTAQAAPAAAQAGVTGFTGMPYDFGAATAAEQTAIQAAQAAPMAQVGAINPSAFQTAPISAQEHLQAMSELSNPPYEFGAATAAEQTAIQDAFAAQRPSTFAERFKAMPGKDLVKYGIAAATPALMEQPEYKRPELDREQIRYAYNPGRVDNPRAKYPADYRGEYAYFRPQYVRLAEGGFLNRGMGDSTDDYKYTYDPLTQSYKKVEPPKPKKAGESDSKPELIGAGDNVTDVLGPGLSAAVLSAANEVGITNAFGNADSTFEGGPDASAIAGDIAGIGPSDVGAVAASVGASDVGASDVGPGEADGGLLRKRVGGLAALGRGGYSHLGDYSDGGRLLRGPGDGVSDSIPATIGNKRPARLADGEFVIPARIVSELGNGSTEAGARKLYAMMDRVQRARGKTTGKGKVAKNTRSEKYLPA